MGKGSFGCLMAIGVAIIVVLSMAVIGQEINNREAEEIASNPLYESTEYVQTLAESMIKERLKDPDSYEFIDMYEVQSSKEDEKLFVVKYRAKNGFGGYNVCQALFSCDKDQLNIIANED
nr:MAG: protein of unknown function (DUF2880) [Bacteriophage sp.]